MSDRTWYDRYELNGYVKRPHNIDCDWEYDKLVALSQANANKSKQVKQTESKPDHRILLTIA